MAALKYWVWLTTLPGLTNRSKLLLLEHFPSPEDIYYAQPEDLPPVEGLSSSQAAPHIVKHFLRPADRKCRNDQISTFGKRGIHHLCQFCRIIRRCIVIAVSISGFHDHIVRFLKIFRITDQWTVAVSNIPGKDKFSCLAILSHPYFNRGGAKQMPRIDKPYGQSLADLHRFMVCTWNEML